MNINEKIHEALEHHRKGNLKQAEEIYNDILRIHPDHFYALHYLGVLCMQLGNFDLAIEHIKRAIEINPADPHAYYNLGIAYQSKGLLDDAVTAYLKSIQLNPSNADSLVNLGNIYKDTAQLDKAISCYKKALQIDSHHGAAYNNLGIVFKQKGQLEDAVASYKKALDLTPDSPSVILNLGTALQELGRLHEAISIYEKALSTKPDSPDILFHLGTAVMEYCKQEEALHAFEGVLRNAPNSFHAALAHCIAQIPIIYTDESSISTSRKKYHDELVNLYNIVKHMDIQQIDAASKAVGSNQPFYLAYQGLNDRELQRVYGELTCRIMGLRYPQFAEHLQIQRPAPGELIRIGFVSGHFYNHSVWKIPTKGWLQQLDRRRFEMYGYYTYRKKDEETELAREYCKKFVEDVISFEDLCRCIRDDNVHVLVFPEIGMDPITLKLATLRLAPVQCVSWGHPTTSGLPTIDYYLSSDLMEPTDADEHYTEKLMRLPNLSSFYSPVDIKKKQLDLKLFGTRADSVIFHCCQAPFKYLPQYDEIFARIAREVGDCQFLFSSHPRSDWMTEQFHKRIYDAFARSNLRAENFVVFLPFLDLQSYNALYELADVFLDPIGWSGCNSALEAISCNLPVVTFPGKLMRSRDSFGILTMMEVTETIASSLDEYVDLAVKLGKDSEWRQSISEKIAVNKHRVYYDRTCITALENFFERVVRESIGSQENQ
jgi:protein O-GlcNAc transferase